MKIYIRMQFLDKEQNDTDKDLDFRALENGFVSMKASELFFHLTFYARRSEMIISEFCL